MDKGMNIFRIAFLMERLVPNSMTGSFDADYLKNLTKVGSKQCLSSIGMQTDIAQVVNYVTNAGAHAVLDPHNYGR